MPGVVEKEEQPLPFNLTDLDRAILSQTDEEYVPHNWEELRKIIGELLQFCVEQLSRSN